MNNLRKIAFYGYADHFVGGQRPDSKFSRAMEKILDSQLECLCTFRFGFERSASIKGGNPPHIRNETDGLKRII